MHVADLTPRSADRLALLQSALALVQGKDVPEFVLTSAVLVDKNNVAQHYTPDGLQSGDPS